MKIKQSKSKSQIVVKFVTKTNKSLKNFNFTGKKSEVELIRNKLFVGIKEVEEANDWREIGYSISKKIKTLNVSSISIEVPKNCTEFVEGLYLGIYEFDKYKSKKTKIKLKIIKLISNSNIKRNIRLAKIRIESQCLTRDWVNTTPEEANSKTIEDAVFKEFKNKSNITIKVYDEDDLKKLKMRGHLAVNRASRHKAKTIKIEYSPQKKAKKHIILVGKGLTYDSGGLNIKSGDNMTDMKSDKAGAMTVFGIMKGLSEIGSNNKVTAYLAIAENMIDGSAYKAGDVLKMKNGTRVHIKNTDAEGRIVLFDNLTLAEEENKQFDEIYSFATLTGAAIFQFGNETTGMVGFNDKLKSKIKKIGKKEGEIFMDAEFHKYMLDSVNDNLADLSNTGTPGMGCQKAGLFLTNSLKKKNIKKYLHLDIAGPAFIKKPFGTNIEGGTGFGVRTFLNYLSEDSPS